MSDSVLTIIGQIPGIAFGLVVIWFALEQNRRNSENANKNHAEWRLYMDAQSKEDREALTKHSIAITELADSIRDILKEQNESNRDLSVAIKDLTIAFNGQREELSELARVVEARRERGTGRLGGL